MTENKGLTGIKEEATGFVGRQPLLDLTKGGGNTRIRFDIYCGENSPALNKYPVLRHCIAYGDIAKSLRELRKGSRIRCKGWLSREGLRDENGNIIVLDGEVQQYDRLILWTGEIISHDKVAANQLPLTKERVNSR